MKCSLLTLSSYLDNELDSGRTGEVEAHLVGCSRCRGGLEHLTEESKRIAALAPAHVPDHSVHALLEQLNLIGPDDPLPERSDIELDGWGAPGPDAQPWKRDGVASPLPLTARRDDYLRRRSLAARESDGSDPRGGQDSGHEPGADPSGASLASGDRSARPSAVLAPPAPGISPGLPLPPSVAAVVATAPPAPPGDPSVSSTRTTPPDADPWTDPDRRPSASGTADHDWDALDDPAHGLLGAPQRAARPSLIGRVRERVAVYRALSRGPVDDFDDSVQVVSGIGAPLRGKQPGNPARRAAGAAAPGGTASEGPASDGLRPATELQGSVQPRPGAGRSGLGGTGLGPPAPAGRRPGSAGPLPGIAFPSSPPSWASRPRPWVDDPTEAAQLTPTPDAPPAPVVDAAPATRGRIPGWGDAATSAPPSPAGEPGWAPSVDYPVAPRDLPDAAGERATAAPSAAERGRHVREARSRAAMPAAMAGIGRHAARLRGGAPRRLVAALAGVAVLTVIGLLTGRSTTPARPATPASTVQRAPTAQRPQSSLPVVVVPPNPSAAAVRPSAAASGSPSAAASSAAASSSAAPAAPAPAAPAPAAGTAGLTDPHLLGDGAAGYSLRGIRYGAHPGDYRVVFDLAGAGPGVGAPRVVVGMHGPQTVWAELFGVSSGPVRQPDPSVVSGVTLLPRDTVPGATVYALSLVHPATVSAGYVTGPLRLVLDLR